MRYFVKFLRYNFHHILVIVSLTAWSLPGSAHHSAAIFNMEEEVLLEGVVVKFLFSNPHVWLHISVPNEEGKVTEWRIESVSPNVLKRKGWKRSSFKPGDPAKVKIHPTKDGESKGVFIRAVLPDGSILGRKDE